MVGCLVALVGMILLPASCACLAWSDPPTAVVSPDYPLPTAAEQTQLLVLALVFGVGGVALVVWGSALSKGKPPAP